MSGFKDAYHGELFKPWQDAGGCDLSLRRNQNNLVSLESAHRPREIHSDDNTEFSGDQMRQFTTHHHLRKIRNFVFHIRQDPAHNNSAHYLIVRQHALCVHIRRSRHHQGMLDSFFYSLLPVGQGAIDVADLNM